MNTIILYNFNVYYAPTVYNLLQYFPNIKPAFNLSALYKTVDLILKSNNKEALDFFMYLFKKQVKNIVKSLPQTAKNFSALDLLKGLLLA